MAWDSGTIISNTPWQDLSDKLKALCGTAGVGGWEFLENVPAGTGLGTSGSSLYSLDVFKCSDSTRALEGSELADVPWYFIIEIPTTDGAVTSVMNSAEYFEDAITYAPGTTSKRFTRMPPTRVSTAPVGEGWRSNSLAQYASVLGNNRANLGHQTLNTTGFVYMIKLTRDAVLITTRVGTALASSGAFLMESFVTLADASDNCPLMNFSGAITGNTFSRLPGTTHTGVTTSFGALIDAWTRPVNLGYSTNAADSQDRWANFRVHVSRIFVRHAATTTALTANAHGFARGMLPKDFLCITQGGVLGGDTMTFDGETWTAMAADSSGIPLFIIVKAD